VQLIRRIDTRIPTPLLSSTMASPAPPSLGKLADLRGPSALSTPSRIATSSNRGWTPVVSTPAAAVNPATIVSSRATPGSGRPSASRPVVAPVQPVRPLAQLVDTSGLDVPDSWEDDA
jgi:transcriptional repressor NF-X1